MNITDEKIDKQPKLNKFLQKIEEIRLIGQDPILMISLLFSAIFVIVFVFLPIFRTIGRGFFTDAGQFDLTHFGRYFDGTVLNGVNDALRKVGVILGETLNYGRTYRTMLTDTLLMGVCTAAAGTIVGFIFAYATVRCNIPGKRIVHLLALVPTVSPPFAVAIAMIQLFGRSGLVTKKLLGIRFTPGMNDIYGLDGLVIVQTLTFFSVAYLMLRSMMERLDSSMEEAAETLGASRFHIFTSITLPLLTPGIAASFMLLFVESLADLGNPQFISGQKTVLSSQIYMAIIGEFNYQKASALSLVLLIPTLLVYLFQRYYVSRKSYVSVTGKPTVGRVYEKSPIIRRIFAILVYIVCALIIIVYATVIISSFVKNWGVNYSPSLINWERMFGRGLESILDTTFLSLFATPFAALLGMVIAFLVVRKNFAGKELLDFGSNIGGAVPGTIVGMGFILIFNFQNAWIIYLLLIICAWFYVTCVTKDKGARLAILIPGVVLGLLIGSLDDGGVLWGEGGIFGINFAALTGASLDPAALPTPWGIGLPAVYYIVGAVFVIVGLVLFADPAGKALGKIAVRVGIYVFANQWIFLLSKPLRIYGKTNKIRWLRTTLTSLADYIEVPFNMPAFFLGICLFFLAALILYSYRGKLATGLKTLLMIASVAMLFTGDQMKMNGTAYIILFAFLVRSLPASVRSGIASLQQIDGSIEEASTILGGDSQYTFRKVTLPLILPAFMTGLIFSFTRHMTSLSAIIFLVSSKWQIVTASIMSGWEQDGISFAATYSSVIIFIVLIFIGVMGFVTRKMLKIDSNIDINAGI